MFKPGDTVWVWYATSKQNEDDRWIQAQVVQPHPHYLEARRIKHGKTCRGSTMKPAYEDMRVTPQNELARSLMESTLETALGYSDSSERGVQDDDEDRDAPQNNVSSLMTGVRHKREGARKSALDDVGRYAENLKHHDEDVETMLKSDRAREIDHIYEQIGSHQVLRHRLEFAPPWLLDESFRTEFDSNWADAYRPVQEPDVPDDANVITSHCLYNVKTCEDGTRKLKSRLVPHGNHDDEKDSIRKDSATPQLSVIRLLLSLVTFLGFRIATADIKGAYLQSGPIKRDIYVRPPREWYRQEGSQRGVLWKLIKLPYGIVEAGRQGQKTVEIWMLEEGGLRNVFGLSQLFIRRDKKGEIVLLVAKVTDDFLIGGKLDYIYEFLDKLQERFIVGKVVVNKRFHFNGCEIEQNERGDIRMSMLRYLDRLRPITISRQRRKLRGGRADERELRMYRALAGTLLYLGNGVLPQASLVVPLMQQRLANLTVQHLVDANEMLKELLRFDPWLTFRRPRNTKEVTYCTFSDAAHPKDRDYGQSGIIAGLNISNSRNAETIFLTIDWTSRKQCRVSYSSYGAEILAAATADDRGFYYKSAINRLFPHVHTKHELVVDSRCLYDTITTLHEGKDYRLRATVQRMRNSFESNELETMRWISGKLNIADALTKRSTYLAERLNKICNIWILTWKVAIMYIARNGSKRRTVTLWTLVSYSRKFRRLGGVLHGSCINDHNMNTNQA